MSFVRANLALRDHVKNRKQVLLFVYVAKGLVRFESQLKFLVNYYLCLNEKVDGFTNRGAQPTDLIYLVVKIGEKSM